MWVDDLAFYTRSTKPCLPTCTGDTPVSCGLPGYVDGVYPIEAMGVVEPIYDLKRRFPLPATAASAAAPAIIDQVNAVLLGANVRPPPELDAALRDKFQNQMSYGGRFTVYLRR